MALAANVTGATAVKPSLRHEITRSTSVMSHGPYTTRLRRARAALDGRSKGIAEDRTRGRARCPLDEARVIGLTAASPLAR